MDFGCISSSDEKRTAKSSVAQEFRDSDSSDTFSSASKISKNRSSKGSPPSGANALNRVTSQIKKPPHRKTSPVNWFPRQKVESYLKRKIKSLQEAGGMNDTLDETLGHTNPHYCRVLREKMAAKEAARKVMEARKAAMVEASWCRILKAARIPNKDADALLLQAEKEVSEAVEGATAKGVIMYDTPDRPRKHFEIETSSTTGKGSTTHTVKASFETAFEVDKQVAVAVKTAFVRLAHYSSFNKDDFKDLLRKISENPDTQELSESDTGSEVEAAPCEDGPSSERRSRKKLSPQKFTGPKLVNMMLQRLKGLKEEELASLATIVATCGLNAALAETESHNTNRAHGKIDAACIEQHFIHAAVRPKQVEPELPSLDKFLVKKMTRLEKEVQDAKNARKAEFNRNGDGKHNSSHHVTGDFPDLGSVLVKRSSKLEREVEEAKRNQNSSDIDRQQLETTLKTSKSRHLKQEDGAVPSLDKFLVKHVTKLERAVQEAKNRQKDRNQNSTEGLLTYLPPSEEDQTEKENVDLNRTVSSEMEQNEKEVKDEDGGQENGLDKIFVKPVHWSEREKLQESQETESTNWRYNKKQLGKTNETQCESLDKCLVKHVSRLERAKMELATKDHFEVKKRETVPKVDPTVGGLDEIFVKHKSRIEKEKNVGVSEQPEDGNKYSTMSRREARERELLETWGGIGLGNSMRPHVSRLQRDKAAWVKAEEEEKRATPA